ncbi:hypothetical protein B0H21DRAFT_825161 [Amylocystis lapponica]|nr:hypothetical protein B0H21DRAFT_825161 [Amylocystis lapponica]
MTSHFDKGNYATEKVAYNAALREYDRYRQESLWSSSSTVSSTHDAESDIQTNAYPAIYRSSISRPPRYYPERPRHSEVILQQRYVPSVALPRVTFKRHPPIRFRVNDRGSINLGKAFRGEFEGLERCQEAAFSMASTKMSFRLEWLAPSGARYPPYSHQIAIRESSKRREPITVARLARTVAKEVDRFIKHYTPYPFSDDGWKVGPGFIGLDQINLVELHHVSEGSLQPVLKVIR